MYRALFAALLLSLSACATSSPYVEDAGGSGDAGTCAPEALVGRPHSEAISCYGASCSKRTTRDPSTNLLTALFTHCAKGACGECERYVTFRVQGERILSAE